MTTFGRYLLAVLAALMLALTAPVANAVGLPAAPPATANAYNSPHTSATTTCDRTDRGPPKCLATPDAATSPRAVDHGAVGTSPRSRAITTGVTYHYDGDAQLAHIAAVKEAVRAAGEELSSFQRWRVAAKTADDWPVLSGIVRDAAKGKGDFGFGSGTASQAQRAGQSWVGEGAQWSSGGKALVSRDGLSQWRPPTYKPKLGIWQSNFQWRLEPRGPWQGNGHLDVTDLR